MKWTPGLLSLLQWLISHQNQPKGERHKKMKDSRKRHRERERERERKCVCVFKSLTRQSRVYRCVGVCVRWSGGCVNVILRLYSKRKNVKHSIALTTQGDKVRGSRQQTDRQTDEKTDIHFYKQTDRQNHRTRNSQRTGELCKQRRENDGSD